MGWKEGEGLGRNRQGMATPLMMQVWGQGQGEGQGREWVSRLVDVVGDARRKGMATRLMMHAGVRGRHLLPKAGGGLPPGRANLGLLLQAAPGPAGPAAQQDTATARLIRSSSHCRKRMCARASL